MAPEAQWNSQMAPGDEPLTWTLLRLSNRSVTRLTTQCVWSFPTITFFAYQRTQPFPTYLLTLGPFIRNDDNDIIVSIKSAFISETILSSIRSLISSNPGMTTDRVDVETAKVLNSLQIHLVRPPSGGLVANVHCASPTTYPDHWRAWIHYLRALPFPCKLNPTGTARAPVRCAGCHAHDHPTALCPQPGTPGWNGPPLNHRTQTSGLPVQSLPFSVPHSALANFEQVCQPHHYPLCSKRC